MARTTKTAPQPVLDGEWNEKRTIRLPKAREGEDKSMYVSINGIAYWVPKGISVEVPLPVYERIQLAMEAEDEELDMRETIPNEA